MEMMPPSLPPRAVAVSRDAELIARYRTSLGDAEGSFSRDAQSIGIGPAFAHYGSTDAVNMGPGSSFTVSAEAIGRAIGAGAPPNSSPVSWGADKVLVASSGDLGVTFGFIRPNAPATQGAPAAGSPFFTIWRRATVKDAWRYIAE